MDEKEIFELLVKADELVKYATEERRQQRAARAKELLDRARDAAAAIGNERLVEQADRRLADLAGAGP